VAHRDARGVDGSRVTLRRVALLQPLGDLASEPRVGDQPAHPRAAGLDVRAALGLARSVAATTTVAVDLPTDRRGRPPQLDGDVREAASCGHSERDLLTLIDRQPCSWHLPHLRLENDTLVVQQAVALQPLPERGNS
jgi:hypothetical protein